MLAGREPAPQPRLGEIVALIGEHAERLIALFGEENGIRQMRKWCLWYTGGFRGAAVIRSLLPQMTTLAELMAALARLDPEEKMPLVVLRTSRAKDGRRQEVRLPHGYLEAREDATAPREEWSEADVALAGG
jgi:tRNA-dihydrouridine synthase B